MRSTSRTLTFTATLQAPAGANSSNATARIGPAEFTLDDLAERQAWIEHGRRGAGPELLEGLANARRWIDAPASPRADGTIQVGPLGLPIAGIYKVLAWTDDRRGFWQQDSNLFGSQKVTSAPIEIPSNFDAGLIYAKASTGIEAQLANAFPNQTTYLARVRRQIDRATVTSASRLMPLLQNAVPELANAFLNADPLYLKVGETAKLYPLLPDPGITLTLELASGTKSHPVGIPLSEGQVRPFTLDVAKAFEGINTETLTLRGRVVLSLTDKPLSGVLLKRMNAETAPPQMTDKDGRFIFEELPAGRGLNFEARYAGTEHGRPITKKDYTFSFNPQPGLSQKLPNGSYEVLWRMPEYRWLELNLENGPAQSLRDWSSPPYPVFVLQRKVPDSVPTTGKIAASWRNVASDEFLDEGSMEAVSLIDSGTYRLVAAASPIALFESTEADFAPADAERRVELTSGAREGRTIEVRLKDEGGAELVGRNVLVTGPQHSLPPITTPVIEGPTVVLQNVNTDTVSLTFDLGGGQIVTREFDAASAGAVVEVDLQQ